MKHWIYVLALKSGRAVTVIAPGLAALGTLAYTLPDGAPDEVVSVTRAAPVDQIIIEQPPSA